MAFYNVKSGGNGLGWEPFFSDEYIGKLIVRASNDDLFCLYSDMPGEVYADSRGYLRKSTDDGVTWGSQETVTHVAKTFPYAVAIDSNNNIFALYLFSQVAPNPDKVFVRKRTAAGVWQAQIDLNVDGMPFEIAVDSNNYIYILLLDSDSLKLYKSIDGGSSFLYKSTIYTGTFLGADLVIDSNDDLHVAYGIYLSNAYYKKSTDGGTSWGSAEDIGILWANTLDIVVDSLNVPHVLADQGNSCKINYSGKKSGSWSAQQIANGTWWNIFSTICIDRNNNLYALFCSGPDQQNVVVKNSVDRGVTWGAKTAIFSGRVDGGAQAWYPTCMNAVHPIIGGVSTNLRAAGWNCAFWYSDWSYPYPENYSYIKFGKGIIVPVENDYAFVA